MAQGQLIATLDCNTQEIILDVQGGTASGDFEVMFPDATTQIISGSLPLTITSVFSGIHVFWNTSLGAGSSVSSILSTSIDVDYVNCSQLSEDGEGSLYCLFNLNNAYEKALCKNKKLAEIEKRKLDRAIQLLLLMEHITECSDNQSGCNVYGCTDDTMFNYNPNACMDDGSCVAIVYGCTNPNASNYNAAANTDDGSCTSIPQSWDCNGGNCSDPGTGNGQFSTLQACQAVCGIVPASWNCINGSCVDPNTGNGTYSTLAACQAACQIPSSFDCISGNCIDPGTGGGAYFSLIDCQAACTSSPCVGTTPCVPNISNSCSGMVAVPNYNFELFLAMSQLDDFSTTTVTFPNQMTDAAVICTVTSLNLSKGNVNAVVGASNAISGGNISNFTGLEGFVSLENLFVGQHNITTFVNNNSLSFAPCLKEFNCSSTSLDVSTLDFTQNPALEVVFLLDCTSNSGALPVTPANNPNLRVLRAGGLNLGSYGQSSLDLTGWTCLEEAWIYGNGLTSVDFAPSITNISAQYNQMTTIDVSMCTGLTHFWITFCPNIIDIYIGSNIDLNGLVGNFSTLGSNASVDIHVGTANRVNLANQLFPVGGAWGAGTFVL